jgi:hypothetical protein
MEDAGRGAGDEGDETVEEFGDLPKGTVLQPARSLQRHPKGCLVLPLIHVTLPWMPMRSGYSHRMDHLSHDVTPGTSGRRG